METPKKYQIAVDDFPADRPINFIEGWGGMAVAVNEMPGGSDLTPLLEGLKNNRCQVPHWGYILRGKLRVSYEDGTETTLCAGDVFYMPPGHTGFVEEDLKLLDFSPQEGFAKVANHIARKIEAMSE